MYPVTEQWKIEEEFPARKNSHVRIVFGVTDPDAPGLSSPTDNGHLTYSDVDAVDMGTSAPATYQTLERNRFILDGKNPLPLEVNPIYQGYVGTEISGNDGVWATQPQIVITFSDYVQFPGLTFQFDESMNEYPEQMKIIAEHDGTKVYDATVYPSEAYWGYTEHIPVCNKITLRWIKSRIPHRRARLLSLTWGLISRMEDKDIVSCSSTKEIDLISSKVPKADFEFTIIDMERRYDPENPEGVWEYLESRQPVSYYYGFELSDGTIEWIPWGLAYSTGDFEVTGQGRISNVSIKCAGLANHLTQIYDEGKYSPTGRSLFDLAMDVMTFVGYQNTIQLDNSLKDIYTHIPMPSKKISECLQLIANAGQCIMSHSRGGYITILREDDTETGFELDFRKITDTPTTSKIPPLRNLTTEYNAMTVDSQITNAVNGASVIDAVNQEFVFTHTAYTNQSIELEGVTMTGTPKYYAYKTVVTLSGTGKVYVKGNRLVDNKISYTKKYSDVGEDLKNVNNPLIDNRAHIMAYTDWIAENTLRRNTYSAPDRGYPAIDTGDTIRFTSNFLNDVPVTVTKQKLSYNGAIRGEGEYIIGSDTT